MNKKELIQKKDKEANLGIMSKKFFVELSLAISLLLGVPNTQEAIAGTNKVPSAVREEDYRIRQAYLYIWNIERSTGVNMDNREHAGKILGINKTTKGDPNMVVIKGGPMSLMSPIYAALLWKFGVPLNEEHLETAASHGNYSFPNLVRGINQIVPRGGNPKLAREYFLKTMLEVAKLNNDDYKKITKYLGSNINSGNFISEFPKRSKEQKAWIFDNVFEKRVINKPVPKSQYHYHPSREELKQPGLDLKNFYFSLGFLAISEDFIHLPESVGRTYKEPTSLYSKLAKKFGFHTNYQPILFGPQN